MSIIFTPCQSWGAVCHEIIQGSLHGISFSREYPPSRSYLSFLGFELVVLKAFIFKVLDVAIPQLYNILGIVTNSTTIYCGNFRESSSDSAHIRFALDTPLFLFSPYYKFKKKFNKAVQNFYIFTTFLYSRYLLKKKASFLTITSELSI